MKRFEKSLAVIIALSGWICLIAYLYYNHIQHRPDFLQQLLFAETYAESLFRILIFIAPLFTTILGYAVDNRMRVSRKITTLEQRYRDMAAKDLKDMLDAFMFAFINALDAKSTWTKGHSERVLEYSVATAEELGLEEDEIETLKFAALLHDIGKLGTYDEVLDKPGKLTAEEYELVKKHPAKGVEILSPIEKLNAILPVIRQHHERLDGNGYPDGLQDEQISFLSKIVTVADCYDAITEERPYKKSLSKDDSIVELKKHAGTKFDSEVVSAFVRVLERSL